MAAQAIPPPHFVPYPELFLPILVPLKAYFVSAATDAYAGGAEIVGETLMNFVALGCFFAGLYFMQTAFFFAMMIMGMTFGFCMAPFQFCGETFLRAVDRLVHTISPRHPNTIYKVANWCLTLLLVYAAFDTARWLYRL